MNSRQCLKLSHKHTDIQNHKKNELVSTFLGNLGESWGILGNVICENAITNFNLRLNKGLTFKADTEKLRKSRLHLNLVSCEQKHCLFLVCFCCAPQWFSAFALTGLHPIDLILVIALSIVEIMRVYLGGTHVMEMSRIRRNMIKTRMSGLCRYSPLIIKRQMNP